ncbi:hypothetical protein HY631_00190 [Candidatus Uhrbacteria bacterium]|nr:hypothetical protein [Candidatus Uhrbacteria bacterium]
MTLHEWGTRLGPDEPRSLRPPRHRSGSTPRAPRPDDHPHEVGGRVFRAGLWFVVYPASLEVLPRLRAWRDGQDASRRQALFQAETLKGEGRLERAPFRGLYERIQRTNPAVLLVVDAQNALLHPRALGFVANLPSPLLAKTVVLIPDASARGRWKQTDAPNVIAWDELDTLIS